MIATPKQIELIEQAAAAFAVANTEKAHMLLKEAGAYYPRHRQTLAELGVTIGDTPFEKYNGGPCNLSHLLVYPLYHPAYCGGKKPYAHLGV